MILLDEECELSLSSRAFRDQDHKRVKYEVKCHRGGIGRRRGFKIRCPYGRAGSSPAGGTPKPNDSENFTSTSRQRLQVQSAHHESMLHVP